MFGYPVPFSLRRDRNSVGAFQNTGCWLSAGVVRCPMRRSAFVACSRVTKDHFASPTYAPALAERTAALIERGLTGVFHVGGGTAISWFEYEKLIFQGGGQQLELQATNEREYRTAARRPRYSALSNGKMERCGVEPMPPLEEAIRDYLEARRRYLEPVMC